MSGATEYNKLDAELREESWVCTLAYFMFFNIGLNELGAKAMPTCFTITESFRWEEILQIGSNC